ncbi:MAG TPA: hypothetical protein EYH34_04580 [Planctomycetes bacterium]|nr:hypothetical protein [Planctomycetota bacterium]
MIKTKEDRIIAVEVKSGNAVRTASQLAKDAAMATEGGRVVGKHAPDELKNRTLCIPTIVRRVP